MAFRYILFFKPYDVLSSFTDPEGRPTLGSYVTVPGVYAAGRLDQDSEGLMLLTDDGRLAHVLTDPEHKLPKTYFVQVENEPDKAALAQLRKGVLVKGEMTLPAEVELLEKEPELPERSVPIRFRPSIPTRWLRMVLHEGRKRQIRHMTAAVGHPTLRLVRVAIGPLTLRGLEPGQWRDLTPEELGSLRNALGMQHARPDSAGSRPEAGPPRRAPVPRTAGRGPRRPQEPYRGGGREDERPPRPKGEVRSRPPRQVEPPRTTRPPKARDTGPEAGAPRAGRGPQPPREDRDEAPPRQGPPRQGSRQRPSGPRPPQNRAQRPSGPRPPQDRAQRPAPPPKPGRGPDSKPPAPTRARPPGPSRGVGQRPKRPGGSGGRGNG